MYIYAILPHMSDLVEKFNKNQSYGVNSCSSVFLTSD
jgi:hypothetical protein